MSTVGDSKYHPYTPYYVVESIREMARGEGEGSNREWSEAKDQLGGFSYDCINNRTSILLNLRSIPAKIHNSCATNTKHQAPSSTGNW